MELQGYIRGFGTYTPHQIEQMKKDLDISMSTSKLLYCASYYRAAKRDPAIDELKMLDLFSVVQSCTPANIAPTELLTNDAFVAETYADMMRKRHELKPHAKHPCTVAEVMEISTAYLNRAGKLPSLPEHLFLLEDQKECHVTAAGDHCVAISDSRFRLRTLKKKKAQAQSGDLLLLLLPTQGSSLTQYSTALSTLLNDPAMGEQIKEIRTVKKGGLLRELLEITDGAWLDIQRLSRTGEPIPMSMLVDAFEGYHMLRLSPSYHEAFYKKAYPLGLRAMAFASVTNETVFTISRNQNYTFSIESDFLRSMSAFRPFSAHLRDESVFTPSKIGHAPKSDTECAYLYKTEDSPIPQAQAAGDVLCAVASTRPENGFFRNALDNALVPILTLSAAGCDYTTQRLACGFELPENNDSPVAVGEILSTLLGIYRLQSELGIPVAKGEILSSPTLTHPAMTVFGMATGASCPTKFTAADNRIYCLAPERQPNGLPDFVALRKLLDLVAALRRQGVLQSARVLARESVTDGLRDMSCQKFVCRITNGSMIAEGALPVAILIESSEKINAPLVGVVTERIHQPVTVEKALPQRELLIAGEKAEIVLLSAEKDRDAESLASVLRKSGANVNHFALEKTQDSQLAHAILHAQALMLCGSITLPQTDAVLFAARTLRGAGGYLILLGGAKCGKDLPAFTLADGITPRMIAQICKK